MRSLEVTGPLHMCDPSNATCTGGGNHTCAAPANRTCLRDGGGDGSEASCGNCLSGYVDVSAWNGTDAGGGCISIQDVTWEMYETAHQPKYGSDVQYETGDNETSLEEVRLRQLRAVLQVVSEARASLPPLAYALDANQFSADLPPDHAGLAGHKTLANASQQVGFERFSTGRRRRMQQSSSSSSGSLPAAVDWVQAGAVTYVKNQVRQFDAR
jgi:hypothetical protein